MLQPPSTIKSRIKVCLRYKIFVFIKTQTIQTQEQIILIIFAQHVWGLPQ